MATPSPNGPSTGEVIPQYLFQGRNNVRNSHSATIGVLNTINVESLLKVSRATRPVGRPGGGIYFASNFEGHFQTYEIESPGAEPRRITHTGERIVPHAVTEHGLVLRTDVGGNETWQLVLLEPDGSLRPLTSDPRAIHQGVHLHPDRVRFGLAWNPGGRQDVAIGELDIDTGRLTEWAVPGLFWSVFGWSPDGTRLAVTKALGTLNEAYLLDRDGRLTRVLPGAGRVELAWTEAGLFALSDLESDFIGSICEIDPTAPALPGRWLLRLDRDIEALVPTEDGRRAALIVNGGIYDRIELLDLEAGSATVLPGLSDGVVIGDHSGDAGYHCGWSADGTTFFAAWDRPTQPADILSLPGGERWTRINPEPGPGLVEPIETTYTSFDGLEIPALFYRVDAAARAAVVYFHGGPEGQSRGDYRPIYHLMNGVGINVLAPNVRGSSGYGLRYQSLDDKTLRWDSVRDGCAAGRHLLAGGLATRVAAMGGSYGGFMTLAVIVEDPELWSAAVDLVGIANWHSFFSNMGAWRRILRIEEYGDPDGAEAEYLREISPLHQAHKIKAPLLILHGRNDPRVPVQETEQMAAAAPNADLMIFEDEGHGITRHANMVTSNTRILDFLREHLS